MLEDQGGMKFLTKASAKYDFPGKGMVTFGHMRYAELLECGIIPVSFHDRSLKFTFVRNPYDRAVSLYIYLKRKGVLHGRTSFETFAHLIRDRCFPHVGLYNMSGLGQCNPQVDWIFDRNKFCLVDHVFRFEKLDEELKQLADMLNIPCVVHKENQSNRRSDYKEYYTGESKKIIQSFYEHDLDRFKYVW
jgi:hypothetical protein